MNVRVGTKPLVHTNQGFLTLNEFGVTTRCISDSNTVASLTKLEFFKSEEIYTLYTNDGYTLRLFGDTEILTIRDGLLCFRKVKSLCQNDLCIYNTSFFDVDSSIKFNARLNFGSDLKWLKSCATNDLIYFFGILFYTQIPDIIKNNEYIKFDLSDDEEFVFFVKDKLDLIFSSTQYKLIQINNNYILILRGGSIKRWLQQNCFIIGDQYRKMEIASVLRKSQSSLFYNFINGIQYAHRKKQTNQPSFIFPSRCMAQQFGSLLRALGFRNQIRYSSTKMLEVDKLKRKKRIRFYSVSVKSGQKMITRTKNYMHNVYDALGRAGYNPLKSDLHWDSIRYVYQNRKKSDNFSLTVSNNLRIDGFILNTGAKISI